MEFPSYSAAHRISVLMNVVLLVVLAMLMHHCFLVYTPYRRTHSEKLERLALHMLNASAGSLRQPAQVQLPALKTAIPEMSILADARYRPQDGVGRLRELPASEPHARVRGVEPSLHVAPVNNNSSRVYADVQPGAAVAVASTSALSVHVAPVSHNSSYLRPNIPLGAAVDVASTGASAEASGSPARPPSFVVKSGTSISAIMLQNKVWWHDQIRHANTASLAADDPLFRAGPPVSELYHDAAPPPMDELMPAYVAAFEEIASQRNPRINSRVIVVHPNAQMANRLRITVGALAIGLLLDKAVGVHFSDGWFAALSDIINPAIDIQVPALKSKQGREVSWKDALCTDWNATRDDNSGIALNGNTYLMTLLSRNARLKERWREVFGGSTDVYRMIFTRFFRPSDQIQQRLASFRSAHKLTDKIVVGLHIRSGGDFRRPMSDADWKRYRECAELMTLRARGRRPGISDVVWMVVTDTQKAREKAEQELGANRQSAAVLFYDKFLISNTKIGVQNAFVDMLLVTFSDARVLTPGSSYSEFAYTMAGATADSVFVTPDSQNGPRQCYDEVKRMPEPHSFCWRPASLEPSFEGLTKTLSDIKCAAAG